VDQPVSADPQIKVKRAKEKEKRRGSAYHADVVPIEQDLVHLGGVAGVVAWSS